MTQIIRLAIPVLLCVVVSGAFPALAEDPTEEGIHLAAGQWLFDVEILMPMQTEPTNQRFQSCMTGDPITVSTLMPWAESQGCKIGGVRATENKLSWKLRCKLSGQKSRGRGEFTVDGDHAEGKASVNFEMGGRRMSIVTTWDANRVGECSETVDTDLESDGEAEVEN